MPGRLLCPICNAGKLSKSGGWTKVSLAKISVRIWAWEDRLKLLGMAMLAHAFLLHLMDADPVSSLLRQWLLPHGSPRVGWHCRLRLLPLSRLRAALCWLWQHLLPAWALPRLRPQRRVLASGPTVGEVRIDLLA